MKCKDIEKLLLAYIDNELQEEEHNFVKAHLESCLQCQKKLDFFRGVAEITEHYQLRETPLNMKNKILNRLKRRNKLILIFENFMNIPRLARISAVGMILVVLAAAITPKIIGGPDVPKQILVKQELSAFANALYLYYQDNGRYPDTLQGLRALVKAPKNAESWNGPYIHLKYYFFKDPWGNPYQYVSPGTRNKKEFDLYSLGQDGKASGIGLDADIYISVQSD